MTMYIDGEPTFFLTERCKGEQGDLVRSRHPGLHLCLNRGIWVTGDCNASDGIVSMSIYVMNAHSKKLSAVYVMWFRGGV